MNKKVLKIAGIATLVAVVGVVAVAAVTFAQGPPGEHLFPFGGKCGDRPFGRMGKGFEGAGEYREQMHEAMAEALGLSVEEFDAAVAGGQTLAQIAEAQGKDLADVQAAIETARQEMLQQAVDDGTLTQEQADSMLERMAEYGPGGGPFGRFGGGRGGHPFGPMAGSPEQAGEYRDQMREALAEALGLSVEEFDAAIAEGQTPCQIAEEQGLEPAEVWAATETTRQELIQQAVGDGLLTQEQADWISQRMAEHSPDEWCSGDGPARGMREMGRAFQGLPAPHDNPNQ